MVKEGGLSQSLSRFFCFVSFCFFLKVAVSCDKLFLSKERQHLKWTKKSRRGDGEIRRELQPLQVEPCREGVVCAVGARTLLGLCKGGSDLGCFRKLWVKPPKATWWRTVVLSTLKAQGTLSACRWGSYHDISPGTRVCMPTHITHMCIHHTHTHTCTEMHTHTHVRSCTHIHRHVNIHMHTHIYTRTHIHTCTRTHACTQLHTSARTHTHTRTHEREDTTRTVGLQAGNLASHPAVWGSAWPAPWSATV